MGRKSKSRSGFRLAVRRDWQSPLVLAGKRTLVISSEEGTNRIREFLGEKFPLAAVPRIFH